MLDDFVQKIQISVLVVIMSCFRRSTAAMCQNVDVRGLVGLLLLIYVREDVSDNDQQILLWYYPVSYTYLTLPKQKP